MIDKLNWLTTHLKRRKKTPTILQMEAVECGAICLAIILAHYGCYIEPEEGRIACDVSRDGSKAINVINAARDYGMEAYGYNIENINDLNTVKLPCIAHWEFNHFVVLEGISEKYAYINDPATGPRVISIEDLDRSLTGVILELSPGPNFKKKGNPEPGTLIMLERWIVGNKVAFIFILLLTLFLVVPNIMIPVFTKVFIDDILMEGQKNWLIPLLLGMLFTAVARSLLTWAQLHYILYFRTKLKIVATSKFFSHLLRLPINFFQQRSTGDLADRLTSNDDVAELISTNITQNIIGFFAMILYALAMFMFNALLAILLISISLINFLILIGIQRKVVDFGRRAWQDFGKLAGVEMNGIQIIETIKSNALENYFFQRWAAYYTKAVNSEHRIEVYTLILKVLPSFLNGLSTVVLLGLGSLLIIRGELTVGTLVAFQSLLISFSEPLTQLIDLVNNLQTVKGKLVRLNDINNNKIDDIVGSQTNNKKWKSNDELELRNITFGYSKAEAPLFIDFSLKIPPKKSVAIVGASGSGKSTIAKIVSGLYQPWAGDIYFGNKKLNEIPRSKLARHLALVDQHIVLFTGTLRENLTLWNAQIPDQLLWSALKTTCMDEIIIERGGLSAHVAENGNNFSGGQRQRLEIARALVGAPRVLILDEATASLDPIIEKEIYNNLKQQTYTQLIIAHRISSVRDCDQILVLDEGQVVQQGTHEILINEIGLYQKLAVMETKQNASDT